ncbi:uncharacterized protein LOC122291463 [Carya illinoinensis]|uniref:uncharacterized protein LOC122291463 n=1 Tax=Carya illinoinensis TaxID=32201 RepID=UPI001C71DFF1|nr:uncharacterized protein LOC122291463 [Carya illinoinensis]
MHMHDYYGELPTWSPGLMQQLDGYQYPCNIQEYDAGYPTSAMTTGSTANKRDDIEDSETDIPRTSAEVEESGKDRADGMETTTDVVAETAQLDDGVADGSAKNLHQEHALVPMLFLRYRRQLHVRVHRKYSVR